MSLRSLARAWNRFFFEPQSPTPVAMFRIFYGLLVIADLILLAPDWQTWFGPRGLVTPEGMRVLEPGPRLNIFTVLPPTVFWTDAVFWLMLIAAIMLTVGFRTRASSIVLWVLLASMHQRNLLITNAGDTMLRVTGFFLMFAPAGAAFSVDRWLRRKKGREGDEIPLSSPWAQRMIQLEVSLLYIMTFWTKSMGPEWVDGTALHYVQHLDQFRRFPVPPMFLDPLVVSVETWGTLAIEFALGVLIWFKELRYRVLLAGVLLHLSLEYAMNVPLFQWIMLSTFITFVEPADLACALGWLRARVPAIHRAHPETAVPAAQAAR
jgi:uncharacterized membrane protein YphA (DoxX/SURF4 family)